MITTTLIPLTHLVLATYALHLSYQNITRLQQYEQTSEKAAEWSNTAAEKLRRTRTTQAAGTIALILSFSTSLFLLSTSAASTRMFYLVLSGLGNGVTLMLSHAYMSSFWNEREQTRIPFVTKFNEAIKGSEQVVVLLATLGLGWGVAGAVWAAGIRGIIGLGVWGMVLGARLVVVAPHMGWKV